MARFSDKATTAVAKAVAEVWHERPAGESCIRSVDIASRLAVWGRSMTPDALDNVLYALGSHYCFVIADIGVQGTPFSRVVCNVNLTLLNGFMT